MIFQIYLFKLLLIKIEMEVKDIFGWAATCLTALFYVSLITPFFKVFKGQM